jgi:hypothetical protein
MTAITIINSISVKPLSLFLVNSIIISLSAITRLWEFIQENPSSFPYKHFNIYSIKGNIFLREIKKGGRIPKGITSPLKLIP